MRRGLAAFVLGSLFAVLGSTAAQADCTQVGPATVGGCETPNSATQPAPARAEPNPAAAGRFLSLTNSERSGRAIGTLGRYSKLEQIALQHAYDMARAGKIYHNDNLFTAGTVASLGNPDQVGENVARGTDVDQIHKALMASTDHRSNILDGSYSYSGMAVVNYNGYLWVVQTFMSEPHLAGGNVPALLGSSVASRGALVGITKAVGALARKAEVGGALKWMRSSKPGQVQVLGLRQTIDKVVPSGAGGVIAVLGFTVVLGAALPRRRGSSDWV